MGRFDELNIDLSRIDFSAVVNSRNVCLIPNLITGIYQYNLPEFAAKFCINSEQVEGYGVLALQGAFERSNLSAQLLFLKYNSLPILTDEILADTFEFGEISKPAVTMALRRGRNLFKYNFLVATGRIYRSPIALIPLLLEKWQTKV